MNIPQQLDVICDYVRHLTDEIAILRKEVKEIKTLSGLSQITKGAKQ